MTHSPPDTEPDPVLPLSYYAGQSSPWVPVVRLMSWVAIVYAGFVIATEAGTIATWAIQGFFTRNRHFGFEYFAYVLLFTLPATPAAGLLIGGIRCLRLHLIAPTLIVWAPASLCLCWLINLVMMTFMFSSNRFLSSPWPVAVSQIISSLSELIFHSFVPVLLWIIFRRREVQDVFERA